MTDWATLSRRLVELDLRIEDLEGWATAPDDLATLERLTALRDELQAALASRHAPRRLRQRLEEERSHEEGVCAPPADPRD